MSPRLSLKVSPSRARNGLRPATRSAFERGTACSGFLNPTSPQVADASVICWSELDRPTPPTTLATPRIARLAEGDALGRKVTVHQTATQFPGGCSSHVRQEWSFYARGAKCGQRVNSSRGAQEVTRPSARSDREWPPSGGGCSNGCRQDAQRSPEPLHSLVGSANALAGSDGRIAFLQTDTTAARLLLIRRRVDEATIHCRHQWLTMIIVRAFT